MELSNDGIKGVLVVDFRSRCFCYVNRFYAYCINKVEWHLILENLTQSKRICAIMHVLKLEECFAGGQNPGTNNYHRLLTIIIFW